MLEELKELVKMGYVRCQRHDSLPLTVYNYTEKAQHDSAWNQYPVLKNCRGLVLDDDGNIVSNCLKKFFNWEQLQSSERPCSGDKIELTLKMDGSLIIVSRYKGSLVFNSRGSFVSTQAIEAKNLFHKIYNPDWIESGSTYLFEYVSPFNRVVLLYPTSDLVHLARLETPTGRDLPRDERFHCVQTYELNGGIFGEELYELFKSMENNELVNKEGFVIRQVVDEPRQNFRMKFKTDDYKKRHALVTNLNNKTIWEMLRDNTPFDGIISMIPDELFSWFSATRENILKNYSGIEEKSKIAHQAVKDLPTRKDQAMVLQKEYKDVVPVVFKMLDNYDSSEMIWKMVKPTKFIQPFANKGEE